MEHINYGKTELEHLKARDSILGKFIDKIGVVKRVIEPDPFSCLIQHIVSQQVSGKSAVTVFNKLLLLSKKITPENLFMLDTNDIKNCGMSMRKAEYIKSAAENAYYKNIDFDNLHQLNNNEVINTLTQLKGVGVWSAEMLMIFSLQRKNILSYNDFGIRKGMTKLYSLNELDKKTFQKYKELYSPYCTTASIYLWEAAKIL